MSSYHIKTTWIQINKRITITIQKEWYLHIQYGAFNGFQIYTFGQRHSQVKPLVPFKFMLAFLVSLLSFKWVGPSQKQRVEKKKESSDFPFFFVLPYPQFSQITLLLYSPFWRDTLHSFKGQCCQFVPLLGSWCSTNLVSLGAHDPMNPCLKPHSCEDDLVQPSSSQTAVMLQQILAKSLVHAAATSGVTTSENASPMTSSITPLRIWARHNKTQYLKLHSTLAECF